MEKVQGRVQGTDPFLLAQWEREGISPFFLSRFPLYFYDWRSGKEMNDASMAESLPWEVLENSKTVSCANPNVLLICSEYVALPFLMLKQH